MPDLTGAPSLDQLGDQTGVLHELHDVIGPQETISAPNDDAPEGVVIAQEPAPGTPLADVKEWSLTVSAGGPVGLLKVRLTSHVWACPTGEDGCHAEEVPTGVQG